MKKYLAVAVAATLAGSGQAYANVSEAEFAELKAQFAAMSQRLNALEAENSQLREQSNATATQLEGTREDLALVKKQDVSDSWSDQIKLKGDFRYRYESIDVDNAKTRDRNRIRARPEITATWTPASSRRRMARPSRAEKTLQSSP